MGFKHKSIEELNSTLKERKTRLEQHISALEAAPRGFEEELIRVYFATRSTVKAAEFAKAKNVRSVKGTVFSAGDVSSLIKGNSAQINPCLLDIARQILEENSRAVERAYG